MDDASIVTLYWQRDERAIRESEEKYGPYCRFIARSLLPSEQDAEEVLSDTWLGAWNSIPPQRPEKLSAYLGKLTRNLSLSRLRERLARKRGGGELPLALEELRDCVPGPGDPEEALAARELGRALQRFVAGLERRERDLFVCRYYFLTPLEELRRKTGWSESKLKSMLFRTRKKLKKFLREEGYL